MPSTGILTFNGCLPIPLPVLYVVHYIYVARAGQAISMKYFTLAKNLSSELEKFLGSPYSINVVEESARNKMITMIDDRREEERKIRFEETAQVSKRRPPR